VRHPAHINALPRRLDPSARAAEPYPGGGPVDVPGPHPHIWDASTVATLDAIQTKYEAKGKNVTTIGLDDASQERHQRLAGHLAGGHWAAAVTALTFDFATCRRRRSTAFGTPGAPHPSSPGKDDT
jgi:hypothetical protein